MTINNISKVDTIIINKQINNDAKYTKIEHKKKTNKLEETKSRRKKV